MRRLVLGYGVLALGCVAPASELDQAAEVPVERWVADPATACPAPYTTASPQAGQNDLFRVGEENRSFWVALPDASAFPGPRPLFVAFHGTGESGRRFVERASLDD